MPPPSSSTEHRRGQIRKYIQRFTTAIRRTNPSKDVTETNIPQTDRSTEMKHDNGHSHNDGLFDFSNIIVAEEPPTTTDGLPQQLEPSVISLDTFHLDRTSAYQDRMQKLHDRYGIQGLGVDRCTFPSTVRRVQKTPRMRVHRSCHMCGVDFGHGIHCRACHHRVCSSCPRAPGRRVQDVMSQVRRDSSQSPAGSIEVPASEIAFGELTTGPTNPPSGPSMSSILKEKALYQANFRQAEPGQTENDMLTLLQPDDDAFEFPPALLTRAARHGTGVHLLPMHPRSPRHVPYPVPNTNQSTPSSGPGVHRVFRKPRQRIRLACHECHLPFETHTKICVKCGHERCLECRSRSSGKVRAEPDPKLVEAVNLRLAEVGK